MFNWLKSLFSSNQDDKPKLRRNAALSDGDRHYLEYLISKKKKALNKKGKYFTDKHKQELMDKIKKDKYTHYTRTDEGRSGWGFFEYYLLFNWLNNSNSEHYYSSDYLSSPEYHSAPDFQGDGGQFGGAGASSSWEDSSSNTNTPDTSSQDCSTDDSSSCDTGSSDSSDYSSDSSSDCSSDSGSDFSSDSGGGSDCGGGGDF